MSEVLIRLTTEAGSTIYVSKDKIHGLMKLNNKTHILFGNLRNWVTVQENFEAVSKKIGDLLLEVD